jgi:alanine racemase
MTCRRPDGRAVASINLAAIERNVGRLRALMSPNTALCAVVKADGYGHGAAPVARAAQAGGASSLAVATAAEAMALRAAGIGDSVVVLGALTDDELALALRADADIVVWRKEFLRRVGGRRARVHVKLDTGLGRLGARDAESATEVARCVARSPHLRLVGAMTHFATADEPGSPFMAEQLERFARWVDRLRTEHPHVVVHAANSAAMMQNSDSHFDMVRSGMAIYGLNPFDREGLSGDLEPALRLSSYIAKVETYEPGESTGYGRAFIASEVTKIATIPIGYADGYSRALSAHGQVDIAGTLYPVAGWISMDNLTVNLGLIDSVREGAEVLLIGPKVSADDIARWSETINYEVVCRIGSRVVRTYHRDGVACEHGGEGGAPR